MPASAGEAGSIDGLVGLPHDFRAWAVTIAYYQVLTYRNERKRERSRIEDLATEIIKERQFDMAADRERRLGFLAECVRKLNRQSQDFLQLAYGSGLSLREIASRLGRTETSTYKLHSRIRLLLRNCLERTAQAFDND